VIASSELRFIDHRLRDRDRQDHPFVRTYDTGGQAFVQARDVMA
jgi:hypothetical protein